MKMYDTELGMLIGAIVAIYIYVRIFKWFVDSWAKNAEEWLSALRENTEYEAFDDMPIHLVCGRFHGQSVKKLSGVIYESLNENPLNGKIYAFCNKCCNAITTIAYREPVYHISRYIKTYGTFIWPEEKLGSVIEITKTEFDRLVFLKKTQKNAENACVYADFMIQSEYEKHNRNCNDS